MKTTLGLACALSLGLAACAEAPEQEVGSSNASVTSNAADEIYFFRGDFLRADDAFAFSQALAEHGTVIERGDMTVTHAALPLLDGDMENLGGIICVNRVAPGPQPHANDFCVANNIAIHGEPGEDRIDIPVAGKIAATIFDGLPGDDLVERRLENVRCKKDHGGATKCVIKDAIDEEDFSVRANSLVQSLMLAGSTETVARAKVAEAIAAAGLL